MLNFEETETYLHGCSFISTYTDTKVLSGLKSLVWFIFSMAYQLLMSYSVPKFDKYNLHTVI